MNRTRIQLWRPFQIASTFPTYFPLFLFSDSEFLPSKQPHPKNEQKPLRLRSTSHCPFQDSESHKPHSPEVLHHLPKKMSSSSCPASTLHRAIHVAIAVIYVCSISFLDHVNGLDAQTVIDSPLLTQKIGTNRTIKVDINGDGDFKSVQAAIDSVPEGNSQWVIIHVRKGVYR